MFTGIIQSVGKIEAIEDTGGDRTFSIDLGDLNVSDIALGDSVAISGVCLTAVAFDGNSFKADVSTETLSVTTMGELSVGDQVNLELALTPTTRLGGHMVSGHVDGVGQVVDRYQDGRSERIDISAPPALSRYIAAKGSICVDGVSLTVNEVSGDRFGVNIIPHTVEQTNLGRCQAGVRVNLEIDVIARYLERLLTAGGGHADSAEEIILAGGSQGGGNAGDNNPLA